ncbi:unnamed protein product [Eruca vesicaria subsp. sativa]|uniref:Uncharacterized protein n=1 Tax=Eruca vesicaria subsp. sativa TaxID=29727 RepID=A0ABC8KJ78_ERUVS|nr:unnamed protein product [Eruca vesicaria subsp. sativa]
MGCTTSKLDDLPAVALCRDRCGFLQTAIQQRYALADSHLAYTQSLQGIAQSLHTFIDHHHRFAGGDSHDPPEEDDSPKKPNSDSGSGHIEFDSDSDEIDSLHHSSPLHHHLDDDDDPGFTRYSNPDPPTSYLHMNYMKNSSMPPSVVYEQRPSSSHRVYIGESSTSNYNPYESSSPPPPPPRSSEGWDFLNLFDYAPYTLTQDSREVREEEGIPDLEDDFHHEVVKQVHGKQKLVPGKAPVPAVATVDDKEEPPGGGGQASLFQTRPSVAVEKEEKEYEVHVVEKKVVGDGGGDEVRRSNAAPRGGGVRRGVPEVAKEIDAQFLRAAESGSEVAVMLEVGKHPHGRRHGAASSKMIHEVTPPPSVVSSSQPSTSKKAKASSSAAAAPTYADIEAELALRSRNLSSTLHKLHLWEKKLYDEVNAEEKLRLLHERKLRKLKRMDERGTDAPKVDSTRRFVRSLSTKIRIAIQVVDKVSVTINKIRDEELWLQLYQLIQGLSRMWKSMLDCHQSQCEAIKDARGLGSIRGSKKLGDDHLEATRVLGHELINWILRFSSWVSAQKDFIRVLNSWLMKCLIYEPEETPDGIIPFSPGRLGAPMIFVICNQWEQALDRISEKEVVEAMRRFTTSVLHLWEQDRLETLERMIGHGGEEQRIQKEIQELERKMVLVGPGEDNSVYQSDTSNESLQASLRRILEAMQRFSAESVRAYDDILERVAEKESSSHESEED